MLIVLVVIFLFFWRQGLESANTYKNSKLHPILIPLAAAEREKKRREEKIREDKKKTNKQTTTTTKQNVLHPKPPQLPAF